MSCGRLRWRLSRRIRGSATETWPAAARGVPFLGHAPAAGQQTRSRRFRWPRPGGRPLPLVTPTLQVWAQRRRLHDRPSYDVATRPTSGTSPFGRDLTGLFLPAIRTRPDRATSSGVPGNDAAFTQPSQVASGASRIGRGRGGKVRRRSRGAPVNQACVISIGRSRRLVTFMKAYRGSSGVPPVPVTGTDVLSSDIVSSVAP
jgi:hypothetical protein